MIEGKREIEFVRDVIFPFDDLQRVRVCPEVDRTARAAHLTTDGAQAELIRDRSAGLDCESDCPAVAASLELDWHGLLHREEGSSPA